MPETSAPGFVADTSLPKIQLVVPAQLTLPAKLTDTFWCQVTKNPPLPPTPSGTSGLYATRGKLAKPVLPSMITNGAVTRAPPPLTNTPYTALWPATRR